MKILEFLRAKKFELNKFLGFFRNNKFYNKQISHFFGSKTNIRDEYFDSIEELKNDLSARKDFTDKHKSFVLETISHSLGRSAIPKNSPEFDIGLDAFNHSIDLFNPEKDKDFLTFSEKIIKEWVLSYIREENLNSMSGKIDEEKYYLYINYESTREISQFKRNLWEYGIKIGELPNLSPDDKQNIGICVRIAKNLSTDNELFEKVAKNRNLSPEDFNESIKLEKRIFNKHKKYIIALTLIIKNNLRLLCSYLKNVNLRNDFSENIGVILETKKDHAILFTLQGEFLAIRLSTNSKVGEQIKFGSYRVQNRNKNSKYILAAWAFTSILLCFVVYNGFRMIMNNYRPTVVYNNLETPLPSKNKTIDSINAVEASQTKIPAAPTLTSTPIKTSAMLASEPSVDELPATNSVRTTSTSSPTPLQSRVTATPSQPGNVSPTTSIIITKAMGKPDETRISLSTSKVKVGEKYEVHFYMKSGNNGTTLILYQNEKEYKKYNLVDRTPRDQARILSIDATTSGVFNYRWELINDFGITSSNTVTVTVLE